MMLNERLPDIMKLDILQLFPWVLPAQDAHNFHEFSVDDAVVDRVGNMNAAPVEGTWTLEDGTRIEVGMDDWTGGPTGAPFESVAFAEAFDETPVVLVQLQTQNSTDWTVVRTRDITTTGFRYTLQEEAANTPDHPEAEVVGWMAVDAADPHGLIDFGEVDAFAFFEPAAVNHNPSPVFLEPGVGPAPLVAGMVSSFNGSDPVTTRLESVSNDGVSATAHFIAQEEQSDDAEIWHAPEDISGLAFDSAGLLQTFSADEFLLVA